MCPQKQASPETPRGSIKTAHPHEAARTELGHCRRPGDEKVGEALDVVQAGGEET